MAVFSIEIRRPSVEGDFWAEAVVTTDHNQTIRVPFIFSVRRGAIHSDTITFDKTFPVSTTYNNYITLLLKDLALAYSGLSISN